MTTLMEEGMDSESGSQNGQRGVDIEEKQETTHVWQPGRDQGPQGEA